MLESSGAKEKTGSKRTQSILYAVVIHVDRCMGIGKKQVHTIKLDPIDLCRFGHVQHSVQRDGRLVFAFADQAFLVKRSSLRPTIRISRSDSKISRRTILRSAGASSAPKRPADCFMPVSKPSKSRICMVCHS